MSNTPVATNKKRLMITLPTELTEQMDTKARELGLTKSGLVALAIQNLFNAEEIRLHQHQQKQ